MSQNRDANQPASPSKVRRGLVSAFLDFIERAGNRLPDPVMIFIALAALTLVASGIAAGLGASVVHPVSGETVVAVNLLGRDGVQRILSNVVTNFTGFAPLGTVLTAMVGIGVAERTGLFAALLKALVLAVPRGAVTPTVIFAGVMSNIASDAGYVILPPLAAMLYVSMGRNPLAGIAAAFAGIGAGFSANLLLGTLDPLLAGLSQEAARVIDPDYEVLATANYYFMASSVFLLTAVATVVSNRVVEPRLGPWTDANGARGPDTNHSEPGAPATGSTQSEPGAPAAGVGAPATGRVAPATDFGRLEPHERRGLLAAGVALAATVVIILTLVVPRGAPLRDPQTGDIRPFYASIVGLLMIVFITPGLAYGLATRKIRSDRDAARMMSETMSAMGTYIVMAFFAGQFVAFFRWSELGLIIAIQGAALLKSINLTGPALMVAFVAVSALINLFMASASAKWAIMAPVFVPMMMALGYSPESTQALYRVGDSVTNVITPLNYYFPLIIAVAQRYVPRAGLGTLVASMLPYSVTFWVAWTAMIVAWILVGLPLGPDAPLRYPAG